MRSAGKILLFIAFALVFTRANVFGSESEIKQSKVHPEFVRALVDSIVGAYHIHWQDIRIVGDSLDESIVNALRSTSTRVAKATLVIKRHIVETEDCKDCGVDIRRHTATQRILLEGVIQFDEVGKPTVAFSKTYSGSFDLEATSSSIPEESHGFWESTAQPILVTIGAAVIVALFFLIRS